MILFPGRHYLWPFIDTIMKNSKTGNTISLPLDKNQCGNLKKVNFKINCNFSILLSLSFEFCIINASEYVKKNDDLVDEPVKIVKAYLIKKLTLICIKLDVQNKPAASIKHEISNNILSNLKKDLQLNNSINLEECKLSDLSFCVDPENVIAMEDFYNKNYQKRKYEQTKKVLSELIDDLKNCQLTVHLSIPNI